MTRERLDRSFSIFSEHRKVIENEKLQKSTELLLKLEKKYKDVKKGENEIAQQRL